MVDVTLLPASLATFLGLEPLGVETTGLCLTAAKAVVYCRALPQAGEDFCSSCGAQGQRAGSVTRHLVHLPLGQRPTHLTVRVPRWKCAWRRRVWRADLARLAKSRAKLTHHAVHWALTGLAVDQMSISRTARILGAAWNTVNDAVLEAAKAHLFTDPQRFAGVEVIGVDEHAWRHKHGSRFVTVIIDLTAVHQGKGPARLLDMVSGRSKQVLATWLEQRAPQWRAGVKVVAMDGFSGFKTATTSHLPGAQAVMDPFHVVQLAGQALEECRRRVQHETLGRRGRSGDELYAARRTLLTGADLLTQRQDDKLCALFSNPQHAAVETTWLIYQRVVASYRDQDRPRARAALADLINKISSGVPAGLIEIRRLGATLKRRASDILAYFDHPRTSNGPTEAINGRLEHLRGTALGFRNLTNYIARTLLHARGLKEHLHPYL